MDELIIGYRRFRATGWPEQKRLFESLAANGQQPKALIITCVDSRLDPAMVFNAAPGELLVIRNVANLVPPYKPNSDYHSTSAALEFGIKILNIQHIVVMGHGQCGGVRALLEGTKGMGEDFIEPWMSIANDARKIALRCDNPADQQKVCEHEVVKTALANLMTYPWISERAAAGKLSLNGGWFSIGTGTFNILNNDGSFRTLE